jgi:hypothetical protein
MGRLLTLGILGACAGAAVAAAPHKGVPYGQEVPYENAQSAGSISGTITTSAKGLAPVRVTIDQKICGSELPDHAIIVDGQGRLANAVVVLTGVKRAAASDTTVLNEQCQFAPRVQIARPNSNVRTTSKDPILHTTNAQLATGKGIFNVALPIAGLTISKPIGGAGVVRLSCSTHPWMRGWLVVTDEAAAISGADGHFSLDNIPSGTYELRVWHEALKAAPQKVTVVAGKPTELALKMQ